MALAHSGLGCPNVESPNNGLHVASCEFFPMNLGEFPICVRCGIAELTAAWDSKNLRGVQQLRRFFQAFAQGLDQIFHI